MDHDDCFFGWIFNFIYFFIDELFCFQPFFRFDKHRVKSKKGYHDKKDCYSGSIPLHHCRSVDSMSNNDERLEVTELGNEKSQRWETKSDTDGNFPGDTDRKFLSEERKSMTHVSGVRDGK